MLAVLLSFGAVNSLIPLLIIIMLIAAAAGLTRGYDLFAMFGIGTLVGAASAAKKGSVVGRNPYKSVAAKQSSKFMPEPKSRKAFKAKREEGKENKKEAESMLNDIQQVGEKKEANEELEKGISRILETYWKGTATRVSVPPIKTPYTGYFNRLRYNKEFGKFVRAKTQNLAMEARVPHLENLTTATAAEIEQLIKSGEWYKMSEKKKIAFIEKKFVRPVKGQRSKVAMASALLRGDIKGFKEEFNKAPSGSKALIGIMVALATGAGIEGANKAIINELKKRPNYGAQTQPESSEVKYRGTSVEVFGDRILEGEEKPTELKGFPEEKSQPELEGLSEEKPTELKGFPEEKSQPEAQGKRDIKSLALVITDVASFVFLSPIGWLAVRGIRKGYNWYNKRKQ